MRPAPESTGTFDPLTACGAGVSATTAIAPRAMASCANVAPSACRPRSATNDGALGRRASSRRRRSETTAASARSSGRTPPTGAAGNARSSSPNVTESSGEHSGRSPAELQHRHVTSDDRRPRRRRVLDDEPIAGHPRGHAESRQHPHRFARAKSAQIRHGSRLGAFSRTGVSGPPRIGRGPIGSRPALRHGATRPGARR